MSQPDPEPSERLHNISMPQHSQPGSREAIHNLTLPRQVNQDIPPSPPGSPPPGSTARFEKWLEHKKKGVHFNEKLQSNSGFLNPGYLQASLKTLGLSQEDQYASTLPAETVVSTSFPDFAYFERLNESQKQIAMEREKAKKQRTAVDFVPAMNSKDGGNGRQNRGRYQASIAERASSDRK